MKRKVYLRISNKTREPTLLERQQMSHTDSNPHFHCPQKTIRYDDFNSEREYVDNSFEVLPLTLQSAENVKPTTKQNQGGRTRQVNMIIKQIKKYWKLYKASLLGTKSDYFIGVDYAKGEAAPIMTSEQKDE